ncbi:MAG: alginate lyase family protein [Candidatus Hydrogenedentes bacterium]|nr:alginate lyase family protein [Candidatus Hydrogenedentota bacterium]
MSLLKVTALFCLALSSASAAEGLPRVFLLDGQSLVDTRARVQAGDSAFTVPIAALRTAADAALTAGPFSVMDKPFTPPSGDKHDYMSVGPYWWPDPTKKDGLPYINKDGEVNPDRNKYDNVGLGSMARNATLLAQAYWFTGEEKYAERAALLVRVWFLDEATRMNPNLKYGQAVPGRSEGRGIGIIDTAGLADFLDSIGLLAGSKSWTGSDQAGLVQWFKEYTNWLTTHPYGIAESQEKNNHGTWYDVQVATFALFTGDEALAKKVLSEVGSKRIAAQIEPDGGQPLELRRTNSYNYSVMNLRAFFNLARLGEHTGVDLWHFQTEDGRSIRKALDYILNHAFGSEKWAYKNLKPIAPKVILPMTWRAARVYKDGEYAQWQTKIGKDQWPSGADVLLFPIP